MIINRERLKALYECIDELINDPPTDEEEWEELNVAAEAISADIMNSNDRDDEMEMYERMVSYVNNDMTLEDILDLYKDEVVE